MGLNCSPVSQAGRRLCCDLRSGGLTVSHYITGLISRAKPENIRRPQWQVFGLWWYTSACSSCSHFRSASSLVHKELAWLSPEKALPNETIAPGTVITKAKWWQFANFMPLGMRAIVPGDHFWRMPSDVQIEIGKTIPIALPDKYLEDTARYAKE